MTNGEIYNTLPDDEKNKFRAAYNSHPLFNYIDWKAFYNSDDGNALNFVKYRNKYITKQGDIVYILDNITSDNQEDYQLAYNCTEDAFYKIPAPERMI